MYHPEDCLVSLKCSDRGYNLFSKLGGDTELENGMRG
jgi:hypothetical protein